LVIAGLGGRGEDPDAQTGLAPTGLSPGFERLSQAAIASTRLSSWPT
jgi:hypothetical protein